MEKSINYSRYWHGYMPLIRVLLIFFNITQIRMLIFFIFIVLFIWLSYLIKRKIGNFETLIFGLSLFLGGYFSASIPTGNFPVFLLMMISSIILLSRIEKIKDIKLFAFIVGCLTSFVDYLTVPLITLAIPLIIYILYKQKNSDLDYKYFIKFIIQISVVWLIGYLITWTSKWIIYDLIYNEGLIKSAISQVFYRTQISNEECNISIIIPMEYLLSYATVFCLLEILIINIYYIFSIKGDKPKLKMGERFKQVLPFLIISVMPLIWYVALANHTLLHVKFVYRHMIIFILAISLSFQKMLKNRF